VAADRKIARRIAQRHLEQNDPKGWFEALYAAAKGDPGIISWAEMAPNPNLVSWLDKHGVDKPGQSTMVVGCGLGDDAEELARRGFDVTAFDISATAIAWCRARFPASRVNYVTADLFDPSHAWGKRFGWVFELYTLQVLPPELRPAAARRIADLVAPGGTLLVICRGRESGEPEGKMPWPLRKDELEVFKACGLKEVFFDAFLDEENPPVRRFRVEYRRL